MKLVPTLVAACLAGLAMTGPARAQYALDVAFSFTLFNSPLDLTHAGDASGRVFVCERTGMVKIVIPGQPVATFLDISDKVLAGAEMGMVGLTFAPDYPTSGHFFVFYTTISPWRAVVARYSVDPNDPNAALPASELILLDLPLTTLYHNGGQVAFGPDGMLYVSLGDDLDESHAQDRSTLFGSILRLDTSTPPYTIPTDNPFYGNVNGWREEIYAFGFRNPYRFAFDEMTGEMWAGDVGQDLWDEVDRVVSAGNYGWPLLEGNMCFLPPSCDTAGVDLEPPVHVYPHPPGGNAAIIGGRVYNGSLLPGLTGKYIFGDWNGGKIWSLDYDGMTATVNLVVAGPPLLTAIGTDQFGELYGCYINGVVRKLVSTAVSAPHDAASASRLVGSHPNPFNPTTTVTYEVTTTARVRLTVHDARGARVRTLVDGIRGAGTHQQPWDGNTAAGVAASGVYFCRLQIDGETVGSIRLVLVK